MQTQKGMTARRRSLIFKVADGYDPSLPILHFLDSVVRCDEILFWLASHRIVGRTLCEFLQLQFGNKMLSMTKYVLKQIDGTRTEQAMILGRDVIR
jgi:hypothetical protein